jgi:hypothetical protein
MVLGPGKYSFHHYLQAFKKQIKGFGAGQIRLPPLSRDMYTHTHTHTHTYTHYPVCLPFNCCRANAPSISLSPPPTTDTTTPTLPLVVVLRLHLFFYPSQLGGPLTIVTGVSTASLSSLLFHSPPIPAPTPTPTPMPTPTPNATGLF